MIEEKVFKEELKSLQKEIFDILDGLKMREQMFILEYLKDFSMKGAYSRSRDCSKLKGSSIGTQGFMMYHSVEDKIEAIAKLLIHKNSIEILKILNRLNKAATFNMKDLHDENGQIKNINDMPDDITCLMESIEVEQKNGSMIVDDLGNPMILPSDTIKVKFPSRLKADEMLAKYYNMYSDGLDLGGFTSLLDLVKRKEESNDPSNET